MKEVITVYEEILFYAFRYALGRSTYAVNDVIQEIHNNWHILKPSTQNLIQKEIYEAIAKNRIGMDMDKKQWENVLELKVKGK